MANEISVSFEISPCVTRSTIPVTTIMIPISLLTVIDSLKNIRERITMKIGLVIEMSDRFKAVVVRPAK